MKDFNIDNHPKIEAGFKVPDNYFENFKVILPQDKNVKVISIFSKTKTWVIALAAIFILTFGIANIIKNIPTTNQENIIELENYIANNTSISENDIAVLLSENDIEKLKVDIKIHYIDLENELYSNENLEEILIN